MLESFARAERPCSERSVLRNQNIQTPTSTFGTVRSERQPEGRTNKPTNRHESAERQPQVGPGKLFAHIGWYSPTRQTSVCRAAPEKEPGSEGKG